ncbi:flagellar protein FlgN [Oxalobacteraceae bacterium]|nr:flagellar protein FlgN [Oxalobacteraceae bacterium]
MQSVSPMNSLRGEQTLMTSLLEVLKQEQAHLIAADIEGLTALTVEKTVLVNQMAVLASQRHSALGAAGYPAQESGMDAWLAASGDSDAPALWHEVLALTQEAKELNRINGMLINRHMSHTQGALNALRPQTQNANHFYGPSGIATTSTPSRGFIVG